MGKKQGFIKRREEFLLRKELTEAQLHLQESPQDPFLQANVADYCWKLEELDAVRPEWVSNTIQAVWLVKGDRSTKLFLAQHKFKSKSMETYIHQIQNAQGQLVKEWQQIAKAGVTYYASLFASKQGMDQELFQHILIAWKVQITAEEKAAMDFPMALDEVTGIALSHPIFSIGSTKPREHTQKSSVRSHGRANSNS
jgi:hypothetical protein